MTTTILCGCRVQFAGWDLISTTRCAAHQPPPVPVRRLVPATPPGTIAERVEAARVLAAAIREA